MNLKILKLLIPYIFIAAFTFQFAKQGLDYSSPYVFIGIRYLIAALILLLISRKLVFNRNIIPVALSFSASSLFWILGLQYVTPGDSAVLNYTMPLFAILGAVLLLGEKPLRTEVAGVLIGFVGIGIYAAPLRARHHRRYSVDRNDDDSEPRINSRFNRPVRGNIRLLREKMNPGSKSGSCLKFLNTRSG